MSSKAWERFLSAMYLEETDQVPVALFGTTRFFAYHSALKIFDLIHDPCKMFQAELAVFEHFPEVVFFPGFWPQYGAPTILSAFGSRIYWAENAMPQVKAILSRVEDIDSMEVPNPRNEGFMPLYLKTLKLFKEKARDRFNFYTRFLHSGGPGEIASYLRGPTAFLMDLYKRPSSAHKLLRICTETIIEWLKAQQEVIEEAVGFVLTDDTAGFMSPQLYRNFEFPYHRKIHESFKETMLFHCDSDATHILEALADMGMGVFNFGPDTEIATVKKRIGSRVCLLGNIPPLDIMVKGTPRDVEDACRKCISAAMAGGGYVLAPGGGTNDGTSAENIEAMILATKKYGRYKPL